MTELLAETCDLCNHKVRVSPDKSMVARCPRCKGPVGDPKIDQACPGCKAVNRVFRSRLLAARCGKCKQALLPPGPEPRELLWADAYTA